MLKNLELTARVVHFGLRGDHVEVTLEDRAAAYTIGRDRPDFGALVGAIAEAWKTEGRVTVTIGRATEIVAVRSYPTGT